MQLLTVETLPDLRAYLRMRDVMVPDPDLSYVFTVLILEVWSSDHKERFHETSFFLGG
jgi:hypothetical protein